MASKKTTQALDTALDAIDAPVLTDTGLKETLAQVTATLPNNPLQGQQYATTEVITSPPLMPDRDALQAAANFATVHQATFGAEKATGDTSLKVPGADAAFQQTVGQIKEALGHQQIVRTTQTNVNASGTTMVMPAEVRDTAHSLYVYVDQYRNHHYVREKADKLLFSLFGKDLAESILRVANRGFFKEPFVWVSQKLWESNNFEKVHDFDKMTSPSFTPEMDEYPASPLLAALRECFSGKDVNDLTKLARYHNKSVLAILRKIFIDEMAFYKMSVPPPDTRDWEDPAKTNPKPIKAAASV